MMQVTISTGGRLVIPAAIRRNLGIIAGTRISITVDEENRRIILVPITRAYIRSLRGKLKVGGALKLLMEDRARERDR